jgi:hypothetical protein
MKKTMARGICEKKSKSLADKNVGYLSCRRDYNFLKEIIYKNYL